VGIPGHEFATRGANRAQSNTTVSPNTVRRNVEAYRKEKKKPEWAAAKTGRGVAAYPPQLNAVDSE